MHNQKIINHRLMSELLRLAGIQESIINLKQGIKCFTSEAPQGEQVHEARNGFQWEDVNSKRAGYITHAGLVCEVKYSDAGRPMSQEILPFGGSFKSLVHRTFIANHFPLNMGIR